MRRRRSRLYAIIRLGLLYRIDSWYEFRAKPPSSSATLGRGEEGFSPMRASLRCAIAYRYVRFAALSLHNDLTIP